MCIAAAMVGGAAIGAVASSSSASKAANAQENAANTASNTSNAQYNQTRTDQKPFMDAGYWGINKIQEGLQPGGQFTKNFGMGDLQSDPIYQERMRVGIPQGDTSISRMYNSRGGLLSGGTLKALSRYNQDYASSEGNNAFNRFQTNRSNQLQPLQALAGEGQSSTNFVGNAGANNATTIGNNTMQAGNARASGYIGSANAINGGIGQAANWYQQQQMLDYMNTRPGMAYEGSNNARYV